MKEPEDDADACYALHPDFARELAEHDAEVAALTKAAPRKRRTARVHLAIMKERVACARIALSYSANAAASEMLGRGKKKRKVAP